MIKRVNVAVGDDGRIATDFEGFEGDTCLDEAEKLKAALRKLGVEAGDGQVSRKGGTARETSRSRGRT